MPFDRTSLLIAALMLAAAVGAIAGRPTAKLADERPAVSLEGMIPGKFGDWRDVPMGHMQVVNPQTKEILDRLYSQVLTRIYVNSGGYRMMLSLAYGSDQRGTLQVHKPEVCYPAQGFTVQSDQAGLLTTPFGAIPVRRLFTTLGTRKEPLIYWFTVGDKAVQGSTQRKIAELLLGLTGRIPDGIIFRVSSIDSDLTRANQLQEQFIVQLLQSVSPADRKRLSGLGES